MVGAFEGKRNSASWQHFPFQAAPEIELCQATIYETSTLLARWPPVPLPPHAYTSSTATYQKRKRTRPIISAARAIGQLSAPN